MALKATASRHVYFEESLGTVTAELFCAQGDLCQNYKDPNDWDNDSNYVPQFSQGSPRIVELQLNATGTTDLIVSNPQWYYNGINVSTQPAYFETMIVGNNTRAQLKIKGNVAKLSHNQSIQLKCVASVGTSDSPVTIDVTATKAISVRQQVRDTYRCTIAAINDNANYTIDANESELKVRCLTYDWEGNLVTDPSLHYAWLKMATQEEAVVWNPIGDDSEVLTLGVDDIDNMANIKVIVSLGVNQICSDTQMVYDSHDPVLIVPRFDPEDCTIRKGDPSRQAINVYVDCLRSDETRAARATLRFLLLDSAGNEVQEYEGRVWQNIQWVNEAEPSNGKVNWNRIAFTITADDFANGGKELLLMIEGDVE